MHTNMILNAFIILELHPRIWRIFRIPAIVSNFVGCHVCEKSRKLKIVGVCIVDNGKVRDKTIVQNKTSFFYIFSISCMQFLNWQFKLQTRIQGHKKPPAVIMLTKKSDDCKFFEFWVRHFRSATLKLAILT